MENKTKIEISTATIVKLILAILAVWFLYAVRDIVVLFFIVLVIVAAIGPLVDRMARYIPRLLALIFLTVVFLAVLAGIGFLLIPPVALQLKSIAINLPVFADKFSPFLQNLRDGVSNYQEGLYNISSNLAKVSGGIYSTTIGFVSGIVAVVTILVLSFYMLLEKEALKSFLNQFLPSEHQERFFNVARKMSQKMGSWLRGQVLLMLIIGILDTIALGILGVPYALTLGVWGGLTEVVPYIGPWLGLLPAFLVALTISPLKGLLVLASFVVIQQIESQFLVPKIMGRIVGLSPVIIILVLLIGAKLDGILGMFVAVPVAAALAVLIQDWPEIRKIRQNT